jgi:hypothetical protein
MTGSVSHAPGLRAALVRGAARTMGGVERGLRLAHVRRQSHASKIPCAMVTHLFLAISAIPPMR